MLPLVDVLRYGPNPLRKKAVRDAAIEILEDEQISHVRLIRSGGQDKQGPINAIEVNPMLLSGGDR